VAGGVAEIQPDIVTVLADAAENVEESDVARAEAARKRAEASLTKSIPADTDAYLSMEAALPDPICAWMRSSVSGGVLPDPPGF